MRRVIVIVASLLALAACSNSEAASPSPTSTPTPTMSPAPTAIELSKKMDCNTFKPVPWDPELMIKDEGHCSHQGGTKLHIITFTTNEALNTWLNVAKTQGYYYLVGDRWVVDTQVERSVLLIVQKSLGGTLIN